MKIIIILDQFRDSDTSRLILNEEKEFRKRNIEILIITLHPEDPNTTISKELEYPEHDFLCVPVKSFFDFGGWKNLTRFLKEEKPDLVMTHQYDGNRIGRIAAHFARVPKIFAFEESGRVKDLNQLLQYWTSKIIATSEQDAAIFAASDIRKKKIVVVPDSIDFSKYGRGAAHDLRHELGIDADKFVFLFIGDLVKEKGVDILLRAFAKVSGGMLIVMGDGTERKNLEELSRQLLLAGRVVFYPIKRKIPHMLSTADCFVLSSREDGANPVLTEALASGVPVIVSDLPAYKDIIRDGTNGLIVPPQNSEELAFAMGRMKDDVDFLNTIKANLGKSIDRYSPQSHTDRILELTIK